MCEINPKRSQFYKLEFFTSLDMTEQQWMERINYSLGQLELEFNSRGDIRVHIHEIDGEQDEPPESA